MATLSEIIAKFATQFYYKLANEHPLDNTLFSPVNVDSSIGLLGLGSGLEERNLIAKAQEKVERDPRPRSLPEPTGPRSRPHPEPVHLGDSRRAIQPEPKLCSERHVPDYECEKPEGVHTAFSKILAVLNKPSNNYTLSFANKLYGDHDIAFIQKFLFFALKLYYTDVEGVDLRNAPEEVRRRINLWVEIRTHGKIKDFFLKNSFDCFAQLLQTNALYFKGQWQVKFDKALTAEAPFYAHHTNARDYKTVQLMHRKGVYNTATIDIGDVEVQVLEIPYKDDELSFFVLLPTDGSPEALQQLEEGFIHENLLDWSSKLKAEVVDVAIPKFSMEKSLYLQEYLNQLHLTDPEKADFSGATATEGVALTQLVHDTFLEIDEEGGEEAEAPRSFRDRNPCQESVQFQANHPFLFHVVHKSSQTILVLGRFSKPE